MTVPADCRGEFSFSISGSQHPVVWNRAKTCFCLFVCFRRRTNVQQLTCKIDLSSSFYYYLFFPFVLIELKPLVLKGSPGGKIMKKCEKVRKIMKRFCPLVVAL